MKDLLLTLLTSIPLQGDTVKIPIKYPRIDTVVVENPMIAKQFK